MTFSHNGDAQRYDQWAKTPQGSFALQQEEKLLQGLLAPWPRRKQKLLDIGCGTGLFLEFFWSCGFDVTGIDKSPHMVSAAREKMGNHVDLHAGVAEHLPFDDREFDYGSLMTVLEFADDPEQALREANRVVRKGLLIAFLNRTSLYACATRFGRDSSLRRARWFSWMEFRRMIAKNIPAGRVESRSILCGPPCTWSKVFGLRHLNSVPLFPWMGAISMVRIDLMTPPARTPLMAWKTEPTA